MVRLKEVGTQRFRGTYRGSNAVNSLNGRVTFIVYKFTLRRARSSNRVRRVEGRVEEEREARSRRISTEKYPRRCA